MRDPNLKLKQGKTVKAAVKNFEFPIFLSRRLLWRAHIIQALMADIGSTLVDSPPTQGKERRLDTTQRNLKRKKIIHKKTTQHWWILPHKERKLNTRKRVKQTNERDNKIFLFFL